MPVPLPPSGPPGYQLLKNKSWFFFTFTSQHLVQGSKHGKDDSVESVPYQGLKALGFSLDFFTSLFTSQGFKLVWVKTRTSCSVAQHRICFIHPTGTATYLFYKSLGQNFRHLPALKGGVTTPEVCGPCPSFICLLAFFLSFSFFVLNNGKVTYLLK